ncbi:tRNA pseudouridine(55) synthase TruB [Patescibacteria group bacterium]
MSNSGYILINKSARLDSQSQVGARRVGPTSHDVIDKLRKITGIKKIGHAGTLDPFAQGLLLVAIGREATREISKFVGLDKEYVANLKFGAISDTYDLTGRIKIQEYKNIKINKIIIKNILKKFIGKQEQIPPMFSAKKVGGKKLYELARQGIEITRKPNQIEVYDIKLLKWSNVKCQLSIVVHCSSGTYIRSLAHDIGQILVCGAYLEKLVRTKIGKFKLTDAIELDKLNKENWQKRLLVISDKLLG